MVETLVFKPNSGAGSHYKTNQKDSFRFWGPPFLLGQFLSILFEKKLGKTQTKQWNQNNLESCGTVAQKQKMEVVQMDDAENSNHSLTQIGR